MSSLDKWLLTQSENEKNNIAKTNSNRNKETLEKVKKLEDDIESLSNLSLVSTEPTSIDVSDYEAVEDPIFNTPSPSFTFIDHKKSSQFDFNYRSTASFQSKTYDLYELSQKSDLSYEELRYIFAFSVRQEKFRQLVEPDIFSALLKKKTLAKKANVIENATIPLSAPKYDIAELAKRTTHTQEEIVWVLRDAKRRDTLRELAPELLYSFQQTTKPYHDKDNNASTQDDIAELAKRTTHTQEEIDWILKSPERKNILRSLDPQLLALFHESNSPYAKKNTPQKASSASSTKKSRPLIQQAPKYDIAELAKRTTHTQEEMLWVLNSSKRRGILKELAPELIATFKTLCNDK